MIDMVSNMVIGWAAIMLREREIIPGRQERDEWA